MTFERLKYFYDIVRCGSFTAAAKENYITQSTISQQIAAMENELGFSLLERTTRGITLTKQGESFYADIQPILLSYTQAVARAKSFQGTVNPFFTLAAVDALDLTRIFRTAVLIREAYPTGEVSLNQGTPVWCKNEFDLSTAAAVVSTPYDYLEDTSNDYTILPLFSSAYDLVLSRDHPLAQLDQVSLDMLRDETMIVESERVMGPRAFSHIVIEQMQYGHDFRHIRTVPSRETKEMRVATGAGYMLIPQCFTLLSPEFFRRIKVTDLDDVCDFAFITRNSKTTSAFLQDYSKLLQQAYQN